MLNGDQLLQVLNELNELNEGKGKGKEREMVDFKYSSGSQDDIQAGMYTLVLCINSGSHLMVMAAVAPDATMLGLSSRPRCKVGQGCSPFPD